MLRLSGVWDISVCVDETGKVLSVKLVALVMVNYISQCFAGYNYKKRTLGHRPVESFSIFYLFQGLTMTVYVGENPRRTIPGLS